MLQFKLLFADIVAITAWLILLLQDAPVPVVLPSEWPSVWLAYLPVFLILVTSIATWFESRRTTAKVHVVEETVKNVELQGNSALMAHLKNTSRLLKLLSDDHPENAALKSEYEASLHDIEIHAKNQAIIDDRKKQGT